MHCHSIREADRDINRGAGGIADRPRVPSSRRRSYGDVASIAWPARLVTLKTSFASFTPRGLRSRRQSNRLIRLRRPAKRSSTCSASSQSSKRTSARNASLRASPPRRRKGVYKGRPPSIEAAKVASLKAEGLGATEIAEKLGIGRASVYRAPARLVWWRTPARRAGAQPSMSDPYGLVLGVTPVGDCNPRMPTASSSFPRKLLVVFTAVGMLGEA